EGMTEYAPAALLVVVPITVPVTFNSSIVVFAAAVPVKCGCFTFVIPSPSTPESSDGRRAGVEGTTTVDEVETTSAKLPLGVLVLPAASTAWARSEYEPSASGLAGVTEYEPLGPAVAVPVGVPLASINGIVAFASAAPTRCG